MYWKCTNFYWTKIIVFIIYFYLLQIQLQSRYFLKTSHLVKTVKHIIIIINKNLTIFRDDDIIVFIRYLTLLPTTMITFSKPSAFQTIFHQYHSFFSISNITGFTTTKTRIAILTPTPIDVIATHISAATTSIITFSVCFSISNPPSLTLKSRVDKIQINPYAKRR